MIAKLEKTINIWCNRWLSRVGRLVLVKSVLEAILAYRMSLAWIRKAILEKTRKICANFLWSGRKEHMVIPWVKWDQIAKPKDTGGWGLKNINLFAKAMAAKVGWRLLTTTSLWIKVVYHKYISPVPLWDWIRNLVNITPGTCSIIWKAICDAFPLIIEHVPGVMLTSLLEHAQ